MLRKWLAAQTQARQRLLQRMPNRPTTNLQWLHRYAWLTAAMTFLLLIAGGLVTSTDSGLAVPDWPLSYGTLFPPMVGGIRYEHTHRLIAAVVGLMIAGLALWLWRAEPRRWVRHLGTSALGAVILQALLGGLTVLLVLPAPISIAHACLGQLVFGLVVSVAVVTAPDWQINRVVDRNVHARSMLLSGLMVLQLFLGAILRHSGQAILWHVGGAVAVVAALAAILWRVIRHGGGPHVRPLAVMLGVAVAGQVLLGLLVVASGAQVMLATVHLALGALILAGACALIWMTVGDARIDAARLFRSVNDYLQLTKPRLTILALFTTLVGFLMGADRPIEWRTMFLTVLGAGLVGAGANALNQWAERDVDALMRRTQSRPLPAGRLKPGNALLFGLSCAIVGLLDLLLWVNPLSSLLALLTLISYNALYTPLKRKTALCTLIGAVPGALPPLIGWAAARGALGLEAWVLFAMLFLWQLPHFLAIAWLHREDYARAGFQMLPVIDPGGASTARQMVLYGVALLPISLLPTMLHLTGPLYFAGAAVGGVWFASAAWSAARTRSCALASRLFGASVVYLPLVLLLMVLDRNPL